jgi:hypothetical protein
MININTHILLILSMFFIVKNDVYFFSTHLQLIKNNTPYFPIKVYGTYVCMSDNNLYEINATTFTICMINLHQSCIIKKIFCTGYSFCLIVASTGYFYLCKSIESNNRPFTIKTTLPNSCNLENVSSLHHIELKNGRIMLFYICDEKMFAYYGHDLLIDNSVKYIVDVFLLDQNVVIIIYQTNNLDIVKFEIHGQNYQKKTILKNADDFAVNMRDCIKTTNGYYCIDDGILYNINWNFNVRSKYVHNCNLIKICEGYFLNLFLLTADNKLLQYDKLTNNVTHIISDVQL